MERAADDLASEVVASALVTPVELAAPTEKKTGYLLQKADHLSLTSDSQLALALVAP